MKKCDLCPTLAEARRVCWPEVLQSDPTRDPQILVVAESPGIEEDRAGRPLIGASGEECRHMLLVNGLFNRGVRLANVVWCHPPGNRDPHPAEVSTCTETHLLPLIQQMKPQWVISMGAVSTRFFLGDANMEMDHGIPRPVTVGNHEFTLIPSYHPAAGLHSPETMILFHRDIQVAAAVIRGDLPSVPPVDGFDGNEYYEIIDSPGMVETIIWDSPVVAVDTEWAKGQPWGLSFSVAPGASFVVHAASGPALAALGSLLAYGHPTAGSPPPTTVIHNAAYDIPVLAQMGVHPARIADTMVMAYLLQDEPQGLKPLAARHCGMKMDAYGDMVGEATRAKAIQYLEMVAGIEWPDPKPVLEWAKGEPKVRQPQNIRRKVKRVLADVEEGEPVDPYHRWLKMDGRGEVEAELWPLVEAELDEIDQEAATHYSARDADATIRVYPILWGRIQAMGLEETFWRDMRAMPMVVDMMGKGMPIDHQAFGRLSQYLQDRMDEVQREIEALVGEHLDGKAANPASYPQMSTLIYDRLRLHEAGGRFKSKKGAKEKSTANDILMRYIGIHPVVQKIIDWREYQKLKTAYADSIPQMAEGDRIHTTLRLTRTTTGRLSSSSPNLMAQPQRSAEGRKVRDCYLAPPGWVFLSGDYSQVEMRVAASEAEDEQMMSIFWQGEDIHSQTASRMFGVPVPQLDEMKHRYPAKRVGFGILNLITAEGLQRELAVGGADQWTVADCQEMIRAWFDVYPGVAAYMKASGEHAKRKGYVRDCWGRVRWIPGIRSPNRWTRIEAERQAGNAPIQMGAQGVIKEAMGRLVPFYREREDVWPLIQIHDDIVWEVRAESIGEVKPRIKKIMEGAASRGFMVPLEVDFKWGPRWGSMGKET